MKYAVLIAILAAECAFFVHQNQPQVWNRIVDLVTPLSATEVEQPIIPPVEQAPIAQIDKPSASPVEKNFYSSFALSCAAALDMDDNGWKDL